MPLTTEPSLQHRVTAFSSVDNPIFYPPCAYITDFDFSLFDVYVGHETTKGVIRCKEKSGPLHGLRPEKVGEKTNLFKSQTSNQLCLALNAHRCTSSQRPLSGLRTSVLAAALQGERETLATTRQRFRMGTGCTSPGIRERERGSPGFRLTGDQRSHSLQRMHSDLPAMPSLTP